jgi:hypothetical protein
MPSMEVILDRRVKSTKRDGAGNIVALCHPTESWSPRRLADVLRDIRGGRRSYYIEEPERRRYVRVVDGSPRITLDETSQKWLDVLPRN